MLCNTKRMVRSARWSVTAIYTGFWQNISQIIVNKGFFLFFTLRPHGKSVRLVLITVSPGWGSDDTSLTD
ncbi:hypothetical protein PCO31111_02360 [Pandoraea communis]|uniref:Uncharacterized protein n=1 Tax=Pandoraea communis TaxID=2508297 RepID=A0A5E4UZ38_9BURK|nr:hypothetical protein PCO31111_02360 [Pandoraea communis]